MKKTLFLMLCWLLAVAAHAEIDSMSVSVRVSNAFTGEVVEDGEVELLAPDSTFLRKGFFSYNTENGVRTRSMVGAKLTESGQYILRVSHKDYFTEYFPFKVRLPRNSALGMYLPGIVKMRKRPKDNMLGGVSIKATKVKMLYKGDTIVYNADAFQLSQGSMLDALIEQLPGAELHENGVITVNGKTVSSLLVNGKDFFRGDPKIALENLPAYMVDKVKVYEQQTIKEKLTGVAEPNRPIVMDVNLKKQYSVGWIANAEAAYGTHDKYLGRLFALRFTKCSRIALFGNLNNTNDTRRPGQRGDWTPSYLPDGVQTSKTAGAEYYYGNKQNTFEWTSNVNVSHFDNRILTHSNGESFLPGGNAFSVGFSDSRQRYTSVSSEHSLKTEGGDHYQKGVLRFDYDRNTYFSLSRRGEFMGDPYKVVTSGVLDSLFLPGGSTLGSLARYRRSIEARSRGTNWSVGVPSYTIFGCPLKRFGNNDMVAFEFSGNYDKHTSRSFDNYNLEYMADETPADDFRNRYRTKPSRHYNYKTRLSYSMGRPKKININGGMSYSYQQDYRSGRYDLFRLDRLDGWGSGTGHPLGTLPSASSDMQQALDIFNSEHSELWQGVHELGFNVRYREEAHEKLHSTVWLNVPVRFLRDHLLYDRTRHYDLNRHKVTVTPSVQIQEDLKTGKYSTTLQVSYGLATAQPDLLKTVDVVNDADPLYVRLGNPSLRAAVTHEVELKLSTSTRETWWKNLYRLNLSYRRTHNAMGTERSYDPLTGGYTLRPVNVGGNWRTDGSLAFDGEFGKNKEFSWGSTSSYTFDHNVDMANVVGGEAGARSTVKNLYLRQQLTLNYSKAGWNIGARVRGNYNNLTGNRSDFSNIHAWDYNYGLTARVPLPFGFGLSTDFTVFSRRGYGDRELNTDDFIWNMRLECTVLHGNLTFALDGFDLLHELSKVTRVVNAQGRTESYTNVLPAYFMLHAIYRFNKEPRKKE